MAVLERRQAPECTCGKMGAQYGEPHEPGCPRFRDRSAARAVLTALERRYFDGTGEWVYFEEAWGIDAFAIRCWTSGIGHRRIAFEVKVSRSDFLSEIRKPSKRQNALDLSHCFYFVTPRGLVRKDELPPEAGLMEIAENGSSRVIVRAPVRAPRTLKFSEALYLIRNGMFRSGVMELRARERRALERADSYSAAHELDVERLAAIRGRLIEHAGHLVTVGSHWRGAWQPHSWLPARENVECYVESVDNRSHERCYVTLRTLDGVDMWRFLYVGEMLERFVPA